MVSSHAWLTLAAAVLLLPAIASWTALLKVLLRVLVFLLACLCLSFALSFLVEVKRAQRTETRRLAPFYWATPAAWASTKTKYQWTLSRATAHAPLHGSMSTELNEATKEVFELLIETFVGKWFDLITGPAASQAFKDAVEHLIRHSLTGLIHRAEKVDWASVLVNIIVPRVTKHLNQFRDAEIKLKGSGKVAEADEMDLLLANLYSGSNVRLHPAVNVASYNTRASEEAHLRQLVDSLLPLLMPESEVNSGAVRIVAREIVATTIALRIIEKLADPDFWNKLIEDKAGAAVREQKMVRELRDALDAAPPSRSRSTRMKHASGPAISAESGAKEFDVFLRSIKRCATVGEARRLRSDVDVNIRKTQNSLAAVANANEREQRHRAAELTVYLERLTHARLRLNERLQELGETVETNAQAPAIKSAISLSDILSQPEALPLFMEYADRRRQLPLLEFYLTVEGLKAPLEDLGSTPRPAMDTVSMQQDAQMLWATYFANSRLHFDERDIAVLREAAQGSSLLSLQEAARVKSCIASLQRQAFYDLEDHLYAGFVQSDLYIKASALSAAPAPVRPLQRPQMPARSASYPEPLTPIAPSPHESVSTPGLTSALTRMEMAPPQVTLQPAFDVRPSPKRAHSATHEPMSDAASVHSSIDLLMGSPAAAEDSSRTPLFANMDDTEVADDSIDYVQVQTIEAIQEALNTILETDRSKGPEVNEGAKVATLADRRAASAVNLPSKKRSTASIRSASPAAAGPRGISVSNPTPRKRIFEDDDEVPKDADEVLSDDESGSMTSSALLTPGRLVGEAELKAELAKLRQRDETLRGQEEVLDALTRKAELTGDIRELRILNKSMSALRRERRGIEFQRSQIQDQAAEHRLVPGRVHISISGTTVSEAQGKSFVLYLVEVHQLDERGKPVRGWFVTRRYSEFDQLDRALRDRMPQLRTPELPAKRLVSTLSSTSIESRRKGLERYLQAIVRISAACSSVELRTFLSQSNISLPAFGDGASKRLGSFLPGQNVVRSLYRSMITGFDEIFSGPSLIDAVIQRLDQQAAGGPVTEEDLAGSGLLPPDAKPQQLVEAVTSFTAPLCDFCIQLFGLEASNNWLRRQAVLIVLQQVLGGTIERRFREGVKNTLVSSNFVLGLKLLQEQLFPAVPVPATVARTPEQKAASRDAAGRALAALMPGDFTQMTLSLALSTHSDGCQLDRPLEFQTCCSQHLQRAAELSRQ